MKVCYIVCQKNILFERSLLLHQACFIKNYTFVIQWFLLIFILSYQLYIPHVYTNFPSLKPKFYLYYSMRTVGLQSSESSLDRRRFRTEVVSLPSVTRFPILIHIILTMNTFRYKSYFVSTFFYKHFLHFMYMLLVSVQAYLKLWTK